MAGRPTIAWRREHPHERLVMAYTDAYTNLGIAYSERPPFGAKTDSEEVRQFLEKLTQANLSLRLLRVLCHGPVRPPLTRRSRKSTKRFGHRSRRRSTGTPHLG